jgi:glycosidase
MKSKLGFLLLLLIFVNTIFAQGKISRVEPVNWWVGMNNPELQLLVYGENIAETQPEISYKGVNIESTVRVKNPNYLFLYLTIDKNTRPGTFDISFKIKDKLITTYNYELKQREEGSANREGFNTSDVMYLITPDRFINGDPSNDNVKGMLEKANRSYKGGRHGGDIKGIHDNLDYLQEMGFTAIWVNPVLENDMHKYSYHGYSTTDFYKVDERFGSNDDYRNLIKAANKKGIKVIMDMILNHCGSEHWFIKDAPTADWVNYGGEYQNTSHRRNTIQDIHASESDKKEFSDGWFVRTMPDLNQRNKLMADYLILNTIWWIEFSGLSGIRMDTYPYPDKDFMSRWTCDVLNEYPNFNVVGEEWVDKPAIVSYWQQGKMNHDGYTSCLPSLMDFPIQAAMAKGLIQNEKQWGQGMILMYEMLAMDFLYPDPDNLVIFADNHDMARFYTQVNEDYNLFEMGISYLLTLRGIPQIYYGTEILMNSSDAPGDHGIIRTDFPGGWDMDPVNAMTGSGLSDDQKKAQDFMRKLLNWRKNKAVIHNGKLMQFAPKNGIYVYFRYNDTEKVMVILNKNKEAKELAINRFAEMADGFTKGKDVLSSKEFILDQGIKIPAMSSLILELK